MSFRSLAVAAMCGRCMTYSHPLKMIVSPAPQPDDILWENISMPMRQVREGQGRLEVESYMHTCSWVEVALEAEVCSTLL